MHIFNISKESFPQKFFIFVEPMSVIAQMNYSLTGVFTSSAYGSISLDQEFFKKYIDGTVDYLPYQLKQHDMVTLSPYYLSAINDIRIETDAELIRRTFFRFYPSRLSATYAFGSYEDCEIASERYGWDLDNVKVFHLRSDDEFVRIARVNMDVVSLARDAYKNMSLDDKSKENIWKHYWMGNGNLIIAGPNPEVRGFRMLHHSDILWEYLIEGSLIKE